MPKGQRENKGFVIKKEERWSGGVGGWGKIYEWCETCTKFPALKVLRMHGSIIWCFIICTIVWKKVDNDFRRHILGASIQHGLYSGNDDIMSLREDVNISWNSLYSFWNVIFNCLENYFMYADTCITLNKKKLLNIWNYWFEQQGTMKFQYLLWIGMPF